MPVALSETLVRKTSDESISNSAAMQDDDELLFAIGASENWVFKIWMIYQAGTTGDMDLAITTPSGSTVIYGILNDAVHVVATSSGGELFAAGDNENEQLVVYGTVVNSTTAGDVTLQWAQNVSNGTATIVRANSYLTAWRLT